MYLWIKAFHIISVITWMAGVFYLPRLFVYHVTAKDDISNERFKMMEDKLYRLIMTPSMIVAVGLGVWMLTIAWSGLHARLWLWIKIALVALLVIFHLRFGQMIKAFAADLPLRTARFFRIYPALPVLVFIPFVILPVFKPF